MAKDIDSWFTLNNDNGKIFLLDPQTGNAGEAAMKISNKNKQVRLQLKPSESLIVKISAKWKYIDNATDIMTLTKGWNLAFVKGGPKLPASKNLSSLQLWTDFSDSSYQNFSGTAVYSTTCNINKKAGKEYLLQLNGNCLYKNKW